MNYVPIDGLRVLVVESCILFAAFILGFAGLRVLRRPMERPGWLAWILARNLRSVLFVVAVALLIRALLLPILGIPEPRINDEYGYLLMGDTFAHHRLTNPTPPLWQHFETFHVNLTPTYHSKYPVSQGLAMAFGQVFFHQPWIGVYLSTALLCGAICWALQAFVPPGWALLGGLLAVFRIALFSYWMNSYWGGSMAALGGALALGAVMRLFGSNPSQRSHWLLGSLFGIGLAVLATSRPYEGLAFSVPLLVYFGYQTARRAIRAETRVLLAVLPVLFIGFLGAGFVGYYNDKTTGNPALLPYTLYERNYASLPLFIGQKKPDLISSDPIFAKWYAAEAEEHGYEKTKTLSGLISLQSERIAYDWFFYIGPALSFPVLLGLFSSLVQPRLRIVVYATVTTGAAVATCLFSQPHYFAPATVAVYLFAVEGLRYLWQQRHTGEQAFVIAVCVTVVVAALARQTGSAAVNSTFTFPNTRKLVAQQLESKPGKQLVLVSYDLQRHYPGNELVHDGADFPSEKILWARSKGPEEDSQLCQAYSDRTFWSLTTDDVNVSLNPLDICKHP